MPRGNPELGKGSLLHACPGSSLVLGSGLNPREVSLGAFWAHLSAWFPKTAVAQILAAGAGGAGSKQGLGNRRLLHARCDGTAQHP